MRHQHPVEHNERFAGIKRARWCDDELNRVAELEFKHGKLVNINQVIASEMPGRTVEAIKKARKRPEYLEMFEDLVRQRADRKARLISPQKKRYKIRESTTKTETELYGELDAGVIEENVVTGEMETAEDPPRS